MSMKKVGDLCASAGEYRDRDSGEMKKRWQRVGVVFEDSETGRRSVKLETLPVGPDWSGWLSEFPTDRQGSNRVPERRRADPNAGMEAEDAEW